MTQPQSKSSPYLGLHLAPQFQVIVPMSQAREVLEIASSRLSLLPNLPSYLLGVLNQRNRIYWVVDLAQVMGLAPLPLDRSAYRLAIVSTQTVALALVVHRIQGILRLNSLEIQSSLVNVSAGAERFLQGQIRHQEQDWYVLNAAAIADALLQAEGHR